MTEQEAIKYLENHGYISDEVKDKAIKALELAESLNKLNYCNSYQNEKPYLVDWIDSVNRMLRKYRK